MRTFDQENLLFTPSEWFVAEITLVGTREELDCRNYPCSWKQWNYCENLQTINREEEPIVQGDHLSDLNVAYPIDPSSEPQVGDIVIMRFRGTNDDGTSVYEFVGASSYGGDPNSCCRVLAASCASGYLAVTYADSCFYTTTSTTSTSTTSTTSTSTTTPSPVSFLSTSPISQAREGDGYGFGFIMNGGSGEYVDFQVTAGSLPTGLGLDPATGVISGVPGAGTAGSYSFSVTVTDSLGGTVTAPYTLVVLAAGTTSTTTTTTTSTSTSTTSTSTSTSTTSTSTTAAPGDYVSVNGAGDAMDINGTGDRLLWG